MNTQNEQSPMEFPGSKPPSMSARIAQASAERSGNAAGGANLTVPAKPDRCSRCKQKYHADGHEKQVHFSRRARAWLCLWCHFEAPDAGEQQ